MKYYHAIGREVENSQQSKMEEESSVSAGSPLVPCFSLVKSCLLGHEFPYAVEFDHLPFLAATEAESSFVRVGGHTTQHRSPMTPTPREAGQDEAMVDVARAL